MPSDASVVRRAKRQSTLRMLELEQHAQDAMDILLTEDQRKALLQPFEDVKTIFTDLDSFDIEDEEPTPRAATAPSLPISPPVKLPRSCYSSDVENVPASPLSTASDTIRATAEIADRTFRRSISDYALPSTPPLGTSLSQISSATLDDSDQLVKENINKAAARWKQKGTRSPLRGLFDQSSWPWESQKARTVSGGRKRSRSEDPDQSYMQRQRSEAVVGLGMSFGMASDLCSSPSQLPSSSPPPIRPRSSKRLRLMVKVGIKKDRSATKVGDEMDVERAPASSVLSSASGVAMNG